MPVTNKEFLYSRRNSAQYYVAAWMGRGSAEESGFPSSSAGRESTCNTGNLGSMPGLGRSPGEGKCYPLQYSGLENSMDCIVHGFTKSRTRLPWWRRRQSICLQCGRPGFDPWVGKILWRREMLPTPVFWPGEFHGLYSPWSHK